ncbi:MAG: TPM domain-containing protein [Proteobacteria bacterium]|nr:TPM domain-containing protein [Pseudomonadota bacterium]
MKREGLLGRYWRHSATDHRSARRVFDDAALVRIQAAIADAERAHGGQVVFAVEPALPLARLHRGVSPRERALEVFGLLRVWDTEQNNGVLIYLLLADRDVEIVADRGIARVVDDARWQAICQAIEAACAQGRHVDGVVDGVVATGALLAAHFPAAGRSGNELPDRPVIL